LTTRGGGSSIEEGDNDPLENKGVVESSSSTAGVEKLNQEEESTTIAVEKSVEEKVTTIIDEVVEEEDLDEGMEVEVEKEDENEEERDEEMIDQQESMSVDPSLEEDSTAHIDRMDYADAYDEEVDNEEDADTAVQSALTSSKKIPLAQSITPAMREVLIKQLKYRRGEVQRMRPDIAAIVIAKELQRPQEGLPPHWMVEKRNENQGLLLNKSAIVKILLSISACVMGGLLVSELKSEKNDFVWEAPASISTSEVAETYKTSLVEEIPEKEDTSSTEQSYGFGHHHEHSVRPGEHPPLEPIDETALDKFLTKVEKGLAAMFRR
jgi:hypothetical protein